MSSGDDELQPSPQVAALLAGERVRPFGLRFHVFLGIYTIYGLVFVAVGMVTILGVALPENWHDVPLLARYLIGVFVTAIALYLLAYGWGTKLHVAVQLSSDGFTCWDWRGRRHDLRWDEVTEVRWSRASKRVCKWNLSLRYRPRYALERRERGLDLWTADGWRPEIAETVRDEIVTRSRLSLVEGRPDRDGDKVWRRADAGS